ncbi:MAG: PhzF family phenazine biosynthesis isomerase, partial [Gammaproteobacteria bacterium]
MKNKQIIYQHLAKSLATLFSPMAEVALLDANGKIISIFNRLTNDQLPAVDSDEPIKLLINKNQQAKLISIPLTDGYHLRVMTETTLFESLQTFLSRYLIAPDNAVPLVNWQQLVEQQITSYLNNHKTTLGALHAKDKRSIILAIHKENLFHYPEASKYLANKLMVSRATIYNYLQQANQFNAIEIHQVDSFTDEPFSGNPAGVVLNADNLSDNIMKKIAREMNLSETSFVLTSKKADVKLRYFTPSGSEVKFCGHSTVGALYMLAHEKMLGIDAPGHYQIALEAKIGIIHASIILDADKSITLQYQTPKSNLINSKISHAEIAQALGVPIKAINIKKTIMFEKNNQDLYVTINSLEELGQLQIDLKSAKQFAEQHHIVVFS